MDLDGIIYLATAVSRLANVPMRLYERGEKIFSYAQTELVIDPVMLYEDQILALGTKVGYFATDDYAYYGIINSGELTLVFGPLRDVAPNDLTYHKLAIRLGVPPAEVDRFVRTMYSISILPLYTTMQILCMMYYVMTGEKLDVADVIIRDVDQEILSDQLAAENFAAQEFDALARTRHNSSDVEREIQRFIRLGRPDELRSYFATIPSFGYGMLSTDELRSAKNIFVAAATLETRAAIAGGLDEEEALTLSDVYINRCEMLSTQDDIMTLQYHMAIDLAERVSRVRIGEDPSPLVLRVANYVQGHLYEPITTEDVASALFVSRGHLSTTFKRETGMGLSDYVQTEKMREAKQLLRHTSQPLSAIASHLGYSSQSHFGTVFKKCVGMTPREYRARR